jgi:O-antigen/teichoic acid export membrane protein
MLLRHSSFYLLSWVVPATVSFGALLVFTRLLGPAAYGAYATVVISAAMVYTLSLNWLSASALRLYTTTGDRRALLSTLLWSYLAVVGAIGAAGAVAAYAAEAQDRFLIVLGVALVAANGWLEINLHLLRAELKSERYALAIVLRSVLGAAAGIALAAMDFGAAGVLLGVLSGALIPGIWVTLRQWSLAELGLPQWPVVANLLAYGLPLTVSYAFEAVYWYSDRMILATLLGTSAVGLYAVGFDMADKTIKGIMAALGSGAGLPLAISRLETDGVEAARGQLRYNLLFLLAGGLPATAGLMAVAPALVTLLGAEYQDDARRLIPVIAAATFLSALRGNYFDHAFYLGRRTAPFVIVMAGGAVANVGLCLLFIPKFGVVGAGYATFCAYALSLILGAAVGRRAFKLPVPWLEIGKLALATAIMVGAVLAVPHWRPDLRICAEIVVGGLSYSALVILLNVGGWRVPIFQLLGRMRRRATGRSEPAEPSTATHCSNRQKELK